LAAKSCRGKVIVFRIMAGRGIINNRNIIGKRSVCIYEKPKRYHISPVMTTSIENRMRNNSAPIFPINNRQSPIKRRMIPHQLGCSLILESTRRLSQIK
jgi:hypothetical protein